VIFINYRKQDSQATVDHIADRLKQRFGELAVFKDDVDIRAGERWPERLRQEVDRSQIVIVIVGPSWLTAHDQHYRRRIDDPNDWVRLEIESSLASKKHLIVVLLDDTPMPPKEALPSGLLSTLPEIQALRIRSGADSDSDILKLTQAIEGSSAYAATQPALASARVKVIGFDLDGTLIRGPRPFSWKQIWELLEYSEDIRKYGAQRYLRGMWTHQEWCTWACERFRAKGLTRDMLRTLGKSMTTVKNLHETLITLREDGYVLGLISGGVDVFLEEALPDSADIFDYIYINRLHFDGNGVIRGVTANNFDFEGKIDALKEICTQARCSLDQAAFVGEGFNDLAVMRRAGMSFAFTPVSDGVEDVAVVFKDWDLAQLPKHLA
jgi:phosphoserine phosphatase